MDMLPAPLLSLQQLSMLSCGPTQMVTPGVLDWASLQGWRNLQKIWLGYLPEVQQDVWRPFCQLLSTLPKLSSLCLCCVDLAHILSQDWAFNTSLTSMSFINCAVSAMPSGLELLQHLQMLVLVTTPCLTLTELDPVLGLLPELHLTSWHAVRVAAQLRRATSLERLVLRHTGAASDREAQLRIRGIVQSYLPRECILSFLHV